MNRSGHAMIEDSHETIHPALRVAAAIAALTLFAGVAFLLVRIAVEVLVGGRAARLLPTVLLLSYPGCIGVHRGAVLLRAALTGRRSGWQANQARTVG